ncbi:hypothetical protein RchiOBHm_Chr2g0142641 [Rosa chinensis]|uniref:Uncharacterized protein n=1 Tax=Rosa chinensis TaxID=74649 RepID=A0A2P6RXW2_ROSCH|nr:hypothetical protein RchiOBHm_Chr2g0142641 [Rosa chinensis]
MGVVNLDLSLSSLILITFDAHHYMIRRRLPEEVDDSSSEDDAHRYMIRRRLPEEVEDHVEMVAAQDFEQNDGDSEEIDNPSSP